jgi:hypothetical protein
MAKSVRAPSRDAVCVRMSRPCPVVQRSLVVPLRFVASPMAHGRRVWNGRDVRGGRPTPASRLPNPYRVHATGGGDVPARRSPAQNLSFNSASPASREGTTRLESVLRIPRMQPADPVVTGELIALHPALAEQRRMRGTLGARAATAVGRCTGVSHRRTCGRGEGSKWRADRARRCRRHLLRSRRPELPHCGVRATSRPLQPLQELGLQTARVVRTVR